MKTGSISGDDESLAASALASTHNAAATLGKAATALAAPAISGAFIPGLGLLAVTGNDTGDTVTMSRNAAGTMLVNGGAVSVAGGTPTVANTRAIQVFGRGGDDVIALDEVNGALPSAQLFGGAGNDQVTGGSSADQLFGQSGHDRLFGKGGNDLLFGGDGNDLLTGGAGDDQLYGEAGNDHMVWNPGDGTDIVDGGDGTDTLEVNGGNGAETFTVTPNGTHLRVDRVTPAPFNIDANRVEQIVVNASGGDDIVAAANGLSSLVQLTIDGGAGNDTITGSDGADMLFGGTNHDVVAGGRGNDNAMLGHGDDVFTWNPGDGSDMVDGQAGRDTLQFNGANIGENITLSANGTRAVLTRDVAAIRMDFDGIETVNVAALGGSDHIVVDDLEATLVGQVAIDLGVAGAGDAAADLVEVQASQAGNPIRIAGDANLVTVTGTPADVMLAHVESGDTLRVFGGNGNDAIDASTLAADMHLTLDGGAGHDTLTGSIGGDTLLSGSGDDRVEGGRGNDLALLGEGNDSFMWNPGDGSDTVEGEAGSDTLHFAGADIAEQFDVSANGARVRLVRDVGNVAMDMNGVEHLQVRAMGGSDQVVVNDLSATDMVTVDVDLRNGVGAADGEADTVAVNATAGNDTIVARTVAGEAVVSGLAAAVHVSGADAGLDTLQINALAGDDHVDASALDGGMALSVSAGAGNDSIVGSAGNDTVVGGTGNDTALMGDGDDTFVWNPGDASDVVEGQGGSDTLQFNAANIGETIDLAADGERIRMTRDVGNVTMDLNGIETIGVRTLGGADTVSVHDLGGTDATQLRLGLGDITGAGDGANDVVVIEGTAGDDVIQLTMQDGALVIDGLATQVVIDGFEIGDQIRVLGLGGDDVIEASGVLANGPQLLLDGGEGDDVLIGGDGSDLMHGGDGNDVLIGGAGQDLLDGGTGDNVLIQ